MGKRELVAVLNLSSWCPVMVEQLFLSVPRGCLQFVIVVVPDHTHLLFFIAQCTIMIRISNLCFGLSVNVHAYRCVSLILYVCKVFINLSI